MEMKFNVNMLYVVINMQTRDVPWRKDKALERLLANIIGAYFLGWFI